MDHLFLNSYEHLQKSHIPTDRVNYNRLMSVVNELPRDYFKRFSLIHDVSVIGAVVNVTHLLWFLKNLVLIKILRLSFLSLCDVLPSFCTLSLFMFNENDWPVGPQVSWQVPKSSASNREAEPNSEFGPIIGRIVWKSEKKQMNWTFN